MAGLTICHFFIRRRRKLTPASDILMPVLQIRATVL